MDRRELIERIDQTLANEPRISDDVAAIASTLSPEDLAAEIRAAYDRAEAVREEPVVVRAPLGHPRNLGRRALSSF